jgi:hypothetical protein
MLIEFSIKNFRSFRDLTTLSLVAESLKTGKDCLILDDFDTALLPVAGIYGPNSGGKSNIIKALAYMQWAMLNSDYLNKPSTQHIFLQPFLLNENSSKEPSFFQIVLWDSQSKTEYRYGFEISPENIVNEWLEKKSKVKTKRSKKIIFLREGQEFSVLDDSIKDKVEHLITNVRPTALALTVFAQFAEPVASQIIQLMSYTNFLIVDGSNADPMGVALQHYNEQPEVAIRVLQLLKKLDLGIQDLKVVKEPFNDALMKGIPSELKHLFTYPKEVLRAISTHKKYHSGKDALVEFDFNKQESVGTQRLFLLMMMIIPILYKGGVFILDEFGSSLHPFMCREIVALFQNPQTNPNGAQFIFCSHETYLMSNAVGLRQDQYWFTEKNSFEETTLRSLVDYNIRSEYEFEKNYRQGRFGGVPVIQDVVEVANGKQKKKLNLGA